VNADIIFRLNAHAMAMSDLARKNAEQAMLDAASEIGRLRCLIVRLADDLAIVEDSPTHIDIQAYDDTVEVLRAEANRIKGSGSWPSFETSEGGQ
jgi:hypothetical protein